MKKNKGAALANIMLISAFVMIMASTIISIAYKNYKMKLVNLNAKNNFYACEATLDEFRVGFRNMITKSAKSTDADKFMELFGAYELKDVKYTSGTPKGTGDPTLYDVGKLAQLISIVNGKTVASIQWQPIKINGTEYLHAYETTVDGVHIVVSATADYTNPDDDIVKWYSSKMINGNSGQSNLVVSSEGVKFTDVTVTYERNGYLNSISTNINVGFVGNNSPSYTLDTYSLLSYGGLDIFSEQTAGDSATLVIEGNMYLEANENALVVKSHPQSNDYSLICTGEYIVINGNMVIGDGARVCFPNAVSVYVDGDIKIDDTSSLVVNQFANIYVSRYSDRTINKNNIYTYVENGKQGFELVAYRDASGVLKNAGEIPNSNYEDVIVSEKDYNGKKIGSKVENVFSNTNMKNQNPTDKLYVDISTGGTWRNNYRNDNSESAAIGIFTGVGDRTPLNKNINALVISEGLFKIRTKATDTYSDLPGLVLKCQYMHPLTSEQYAKLLEVELTTSGTYNGDYKAKDIFVDSAMKLGESNSDINNNSNGGGKTLYITYSNWTRE